MFFIKYIVFALTFLNSLDPIRGLVELPPVEYNNIKKTEAIIRATVNGLFSSLKLKITKDKPRLNQYAVVHNFFISLTLEDYDHLNNIAKLTRIDNKNIDNATVIFMIELDKIINEILNEGNNTFDIQRSDDFEEDVVDYIENNISKLEYLKYYFDANSPYAELNENILKFLTPEDVENLNATLENSKPNKSTEDDTILDENEFWVPTPESGRRIYASKKTKVKYFPFMASVQMFKKFTCGGSIIKSDLVITAASCLQLVHNNRFFRENPNFLSVRVGSHFYDGGGEDISIIEVYFHPSYNPKNLWNNLAVMRLSRKLKLTKRKRNVKKIELDKHDSELPSNTEGVIIVGWGARDSSNKVHSPWVDRLSFSVLDVYPLDECQEIYSREYVTRKHFCAGFMSKGGGACNRDVGDPGVVAGKLTGVVSFGSPVCGTPDAPTVFTKVGYYIDWIEEIMEQPVPVSKKRTTLKPRNPHLYKIEQLIPEETTYSVEPMGNEQKYATSEPSVTVTPRPEDLRTDRPEISALDAEYELDGRNPKLFKDFLKTMFNSKEIEQYLELFSKQRTATPEPFVEYATRMDAVEPESEENEDTVSEAPSPVPVSTGPTDRGYQKEAHNSELEQQLEKNIVKLIDDASLKDTIKTSANKTVIRNDVQDIMPEIIENKKEYVESVIGKISKSPEDDMRMPEQQPEQAEPEQQQATDKDDEIRQSSEEHDAEVNMVQEPIQVIDKEGDVKQTINDTVYTLLYLSDDEKAVENEKTDKNTTELKLTEETAEDSDDNDEENDKKGISINTDINSKPYEDYTYKTNNGSDTDLLTKKLLFKILSEVVEEEVKNKSVTALLSYHLLTYETRLIIHTHYTG